MCENTYCSARFLAQKKKMLTTKLKSPDVEHEETQPENGKTLYQMLEEIHRYTPRTIMGDIIEEYQRRLLKESQRKSQRTGAERRVKVLEEMRLFYAKGDHRYEEHKPGETHSIYPTNW